MSRTVRGIVAAALFAAGGGCVTSAPSDDVDVENDAREDGGGLDALDPGDTGDGGDPDAGDTTELGDADTADGVDAADATDAADGGDAADAVDAVDATEAGDDTDPADTGDTLDVTDAADAADAADTTDTADTLDAADATDTADTLDATDASDATDAADTSDAADATDATDTSDAADATDAAVEVDAGPPPSVSWCRLQFPARLEGYAGDPGLSYGRVYAEGLTDRTPGVDSDPLLWAQVGIGEAGSVPSDDWTWSDATPNAAWDDRTEPGNDEYIGFIELPPPATYALAWRFAYGDEEWLYCDRGVGPGADGAENGYQPANAGTVVSRDICDDVVCPEAEPARCVDMDTVERPVRDPVCVGPGPDGSGECDEPRETVDCAPGRVCVEGICLLPDLGIDWCRHQYPSSIVLPPGGSSWAYGRVYIEGATDRSTRNDVIPGLRAELGWGPPGVDPYLAPELWTTIPAEPTPGYDGAAYTEPDNDDYRAELVAPDDDGGVYSVAFRFSADDGETWQWCDRAAGPGSDGAEDGFDIADAAVLTVDADATSACVPDPCPAPPGPTCIDIRTALFFEANACLLGDDGGPVCEPVGVARPCDGDGVCIAGTCVDAGPRAGVGDIVFTEVMARVGGGESPSGTWVALQSVADGPRSLAGCRLDIGATSYAFPVDAQVVPGREYTVAVDADPVANGFTPDFVSPAIVLDGDVTASLACDATVVAQTRWTLSDIAAGISQQLDPYWLESPPAQVAALGWCLARGTFGAEGRVGSPGAVNGPCGGSVGWCRLQFPLDFTASTGEPVDVYGRVFVAGVTERSVFTDLDGYLSGGAGYGPVGTAPGGDGWVFGSAIPTPDWDARVWGELPNDEYLTTLTAPGAGTWEVAYRFTADGGRTWVYCDRSRGPGRDGAENGYASDDAGRMVVSE
jgi:hypothetical protein